MNYPTMEEYRNSVLQRAKAKADNRPAGEYAMYLVQMGLVEQENVAVQLQEGFD